MAVDVVTATVIGVALVAFLFLCVALSCVYSMCCRVGSCFMWFLRNLTWILPLLIVLGGMVYVLAIVDPNDIRHMHGDGPFKNGTTADGNSTTLSSEGNGGGDEEEDLGEFYDDLALVVEKAQDIAGDAYSKCKRAASAASSYAQKWLLRLALTYVKSNVPGSSSGGGNACSSDEPSAACASPTPAQQQR